MKVFDAPVNYVEMLARDHRKAMNRSVFGQSLIKGSFEAYVLPHLPFFRHQFPNIVHPTSAT